MTVFWETFAGRTDRFALKLSVQSDPDDGAGSTSDESLSWGSFEIWVHGRNLCAHTDQGETLTAAHWYLLPIAEWMGENWDALLHEEKLPIRNSADSGAASLAVTRDVPLLANEDALVAWEQEWFDWRSRHALRSARNGGLLPNVVIRRLRDYVEISWDDEPIAGAPQGFGYAAARGTALFRPGDVAQPLYDVLVSLVDFLAEDDPTSERIDALRRRLSALSRPDRTEERLGWLAGIEAGHMGTTMVNGWHRVVAELARPTAPEARAAALETEASALVIAGSCAAALMFASVSPSVEEADVRTLSAVLLDQYSPVDRQDGLTAHVEDVPLEAHVPAWEQGYELAQALHEELASAAPEGWVDVEELVAKLGVEILDRELVDRDIRGCSLVGPRHRPTIVHNGRSRSADLHVARRFVVAHELCHLLHDRAVGARLAIASGPWAPRGVERRANAFAAMLLMPTDLVASTVADLQSPVSDIEGINEFARRLHVGRLAAIHHVFNLTLMSEADRDELLRRAQD